MGEREEWDIRRLEDRLEQVRRTDEMALRVENFLLPLLAALHGLLILGCGSAGDGDMAETSYDYAMQAIADGSDSEVQEAVMAHVSESEALKDESTYSHLPPPHLLLRAASLAWFGNGDERSRKYMELLERLAEREETLNSRDPLGRTPLHIAAEDNLFATRILLEAGSDPNARDNYGLTPLDHVGRLPSVSYEDVKDIDSLLRKHGSKSGHARLQLDDPIVLRWIDAPLDRKVAMDPVGSGIPESVYMPILDWEELQDLRAINTPYELIDPLPE